jgi:predicted metalloprotease with PDZ domain
MRKMMERFSGDYGFSGKDIEKAVTDVCGCNVHPFFESYIYGNNAIDFDKYLALAGMKTNVSWSEVAESDGKPSPDLRVYAWQAPRENVIRIGITDPASCWGRSGLHTGDIIKTVNGNALKTAADFRQVIRNAKFGDVVEIEVLGKANTLKTKISVTGYNQPVVHILQIPAISQRQQKLYSVWISGK